MTWQMRCAISSARAWMGPSRREKSSSAGKVCSNPRISVKLTLLLRPSSSFMASAVGKSTRHARIRASVISSPATVAIVYPTTLPSLHTAMSDVPAPMSTRARLRRRRSAGIAAFRAAMGSRVMLATSRPAFCMTA